MDEIHNNENRNSDTNKFAKAENIFCHLKVSRPLIFLLNGEFGFMHKDTLLGLYFQSESETKDSREGESVICYTLQ
jgi:hypothetical protein